MKQTTEYSLPINQEPLEIMGRWIKERYLVHLKKDVQKLSAPWSDWNIMREFRFTNVLRKHDKESKYVIDSTYENPSLSIEEKILNAFVFRAYNKHETYSLLGFPHKRELITLDEVLDMEKKIVQKREEEPTYCFCTSAFNTGGIKTCWGNFEDKDAPFTKTNLVESRFALLWNYLVKNSIDKEILDCETAEQVGQVIRSVRGFQGEFLSFQVYVDLTYIPGFTFTEDDWAICGPGCKLGLSYLFGDENRSIKEVGKTYDELLYWLRDNIDQLLLDNGVNLKELMTDLPMEQRRISLSNMENILCEVGKTFKQVYHEGKMRRRYSIQLVSPELY